MLLDFLDRLRQKPESVRFHIALVVAGAITFVIAAVWLVTLQFTLSDQPETAEVSAPEESSLFEGLGSVFGEVWQEGRQQIEALEETFNSIEYESE